MAKSNIGFKFWNRMLSWYLSRQHSQLAWRAVFQVVSCVLLARRKLRQLHGRLALYFKSKMEDQHVAQAEGEFMSRLQAKRAKLELPEKYKCSISFSREEDVTCTVNVLAADTRNKSGKLPNRNLIAEAASDSAIFGNPIVQSAGKESTMYRALVDFIHIPYRKLKEVHFSLKQQIQGRNTKSQISARRTVISNESQGFMRGDMVAIGYKNFDDPFDATTILCIFNRDGVSESILVYFFHPEGMAAIVGVAVPYSEVRVREGYVVDVKELDKETWTKVWLQSHRHLYHLCVLDPTDYIDPNLQSLYSPGPESVTCSHLSAGEAAEQFGNGDDHQGTVFRQRNIDSELKFEVNPISKSFWFYNFLRSKISVKTQNLIFSESAGYGANLGSTSTASGESKPVEGGDERGASNEKYSTAGKSGATPIREVGSSSTSRTCTSYENAYSSERPMDIHADAQDQNTNGIDLQHLQLTVRILLNPESHKFYSLPDRHRFNKVKESRDLIRLVLPQAREPLNRESSTGNPTNVDIVMSDCHMGPEVTIQFFRYRQPYKQKKFRTKLKVHYHMDQGSDGYNADEKQFGWYHDRLRVRFRCEEPNAVRQEKAETIAEEYDGTLVTRRTDREEATEKSVSTLQGRDNGVKLSGGQRTFLSSELSRVSKTEKTDGETRRSQHSVSTSASCLVDSDFSVSNVGKNANEMVYEATIFPPIAFFDLWSLGAEGGPVPNGIMSKVSVGYKGDWTIKELGTSSFIDGFQSPRFCKYQFSCQRELRRHKLVALPRESVKSTCNSRWRKMGRKCAAKEDDTSEKQTLDTKIVEQKLRKDFLINHSYSHMHMRVREQSVFHEWDVSLTRSSPIPEFIRSARKI